MSSAVTAVPATSAGPAVPAVSTVSSGPLTVAPAESRALRAVPAELAGPGGTVEQASSSTRSRQPDLPVLPALAPLLPAGSLRRGVTMTVTGSTSLALALLAGPSAEGAWCALVGVPSIGVRAAAELGIVLDRFALVPCSGPAAPPAPNSPASNFSVQKSASTSAWSTAVAALVDGMDVVAVRAPRPVRGGEARRLAARARERGTVLVCLGEWEGADVRLTASPGQWSGLGAGTGRLRARRIRASAAGRGAFARPRETMLWLPGPGGKVESADPAAATPPRIEAVS